MSRILQLQTPHEGLSSIVNVEARVGPAEANLRDDVKIVQQLLLMNWGDDSRRTYGLPRVTSHFDASTGFWIYLFQVEIKGALPQQVVDGVISPAQGAAYGPGGIWSIVSLNVAAFQSDAVKYKAFASEWQEAALGYRMVQLSATVDRMVQVSATSVRRR